MNGIPIVDRLEEMRTREAGFTLIELLVALTVLGLLMVLLFGSFHFGTRVWEKSMAHSGGLDDVHIAQSLIRREIEGAYPLFSGGPDAHVAFEGTADDMKLLGPPARVLAGGGWARVAIGFERAEGVGRLTVTMTPDLAGAAAPLQKETLLDGIEGLHFTYFGQRSPSEAPGWFDNWSSQRSLPSLVRIDITFPKGDARLWPEMIVAPRIAADVGCVYDPLTKHCRGR